MGPSSIFSYVNLSDSVRFTGWAVLSDAKHTNFRSLYHVNSSIFFSLDYLCCLLPVFARSLLHSLCIVQLDPMYQ